MQCTRVTDCESCERQCPKEAVYKGMCRGCAWVELPEERGMLPAKVKVVKLRTAKPKKCQRPEDELQMQCCDLLSKLPATLFWSTPNHLYLGAGEAYKKAHYIHRQKMMGMNPGATDLNVLFRNVHGASTLLLCELKIKPNKPSDEQNSFMDAGNALGAYTYCAYTFDEFMAALRTAGHPSLPESK